MIRRHDGAPQFERFRGEILSAVARVLASGRYILGDEVAAFERAFAAYLGVPCVVGVASGTDALILAMKAIGVGAGDEVLTTPFTAIPTAAAIFACGAKPVFVDIDSATFLMDIGQTAAAVTARTRAVVAVHIFGNVLDVAALQRALGPGIPVIEDACQAHGSRRAGRCAGALGSLAAFSFYPTKNLGGYGDGGALALSDEALAERLRRMRVYGMVDHERTVMHGLNSRLDEIQAAVLRLKLPHLDAFNVARRRLFEYYRGRLGDGTPLRWQAIDRGVEVNHHVLAARVDGDRDDLARHLEARGVQTNVYYRVPLHLQAAYRELGYGPGDFPVAEAVADDVMALPMYSELKEEDIETVSEAIVAWSGGGGRGRG